MEYEHLYLIQIECSYCIFYLRSSSGNTFVLHCQVSCNKLYEHRNLNDCVHIMYYRYKSNVKLNDILRCFEFVIFDMNMTNN